MPKDENIVIKPAVDGTVAVLRSCAKHGVKKLAITSSAYVAFTSQVERNEKTEFDERDFSDVTKSMAPYEKSKVLAERASWDFMETLPEESKFELVTLLPGFVLGPCLIKG